MTQTELKNLAAFMAPMVAEILRQRGELPKQNPCAWKMIMPYEAVCKSPGTDHLKVASVSDGFPLESDFKSIWLCQGHADIIRQHNGFETKEL